jgi:O-acetyl-ADP-ribose deacetylase (regulator of RNase III)
MKENISFIEGNIFHTDMQTIAITVNCKGVMGKGIALDMKTKAPEAYEEYRNLCENGEIKIGQPVIYDKELDVLNGKKLLFFPTKNHWKNKSDLLEIRRGLEWFVEHYENMDIESIAFPALGCGNGGLSWSGVKPLMEKLLKDLDIEIEIYPPGTVSKKTLSEKKVLKPITNNSKMTEFTK